MAMALLKHGATCSQADLSGYTAFHRYVEDGSLELVDALIKNDKRGVNTAINHLAMTSPYYNHYSKCIAPLHSAIEHCDLTLVQTLLDAGANLDISFDTWLKAVKVSSWANELGDYTSNQRKFDLSLQQPLTVAIQTCPDPRVALTLLERGADPNTTLIREAWYRSKGETALDMVRKQLESLRKYSVESWEKASNREPKAPEGMDEYLQSLEEGTYRHWITSEDIRGTKKRLEEQQKVYDDLEKSWKVEGISEKEATIKEVISGLEKLEQVILGKGGKTFFELHSGSEPPGDYSDKRRRVDWDGGNKESNQYKLDISFKQVTDVTEVRQAAYIDL